MTTLLRLLANAAALYAATRLVDGISWRGEPLGLAGVALVFAVVNSVLKPIVRFFSFPFIILTLGLFSLVINGAMLLLTSRLSETLGLGFHVRGLGAAFWGALVVSIVSMVLNSVLLDEKQKKG
ncbi:MAG: phage holin family protein [Gemmatimonadaceae bacterium]|nr:phage holin family protein [Gemmatimonadaceae bacterium]